ncbi:MAG TPA: hypothetical protein VJ811_02780 [Sphingopyxis sp.]|nr:hypothetical protein [Sphingopyxis sp.]
MNPITAEKIAHMDVGKAVKEYSDHLLGIAEVFNAHATELGLGVRLNTESAIASIRSNIARVARFTERADDSGVLHDSQLMTALNCVGELLTAPQNNGLVLGAMQSGKTTTSLALQFAGPIVYLLTGRCHYPIYLITSHTSQEDQTKIEINRFLDYYGELTVEIDDTHKCTLIQYVKQVGIDPFFQYSPTINTYREHVLKKALPDTMMEPRLDDFIQRRTNGEAIARVAGLCRQANSKGFAPLLIIDEPQFGASDRFVRVDDDFERRPCVLVKIFNAIDDALGQDKGDRVFIGLSATPYELHDIEAVWEVKQYLTSAYSGFNYFGGQVIDADADVEPPRTLSFADLGDEFGIPFLGKVSLQAYDADPHQFDRFARQIGFTENHEHYRREVERALSAAILRMTSDGDAVTGVCLRLFNNNTRSQRLLSKLDLPADRIEVIEYFGAEYRGKSVKRAIRERKHKNLPFLVAVTNRARMGDAFPSSVKWFLEFSKKAADLNALLQGLLGRACGYGKQSTVVMSTDNAMLVEDYKREKGGYIYKTSRHSQVVGTYRRGAPTTLIKVKRDMADPVIQRFFERVDREVVAPHIIQGETTLRARRRSGDQPFRTAPLIRIAEEEGLFDHLEQADVRSRLFPTYPDFRIARADDEVVNTKVPSRKLKYTMTGEGDNRFTFREWAGDGTNHGGVRSRGYGARDATDREQAGDTLEPQVNMRKFDPVTGVFIDDKRQDGVVLNKHERRPGNWRAEMVTLPLVSPVRELQAGEATFPVQHSPFADLMSRDERALVGA